MAEFNIYQPVAELLKKLGHQVSIVAEGLSMDMWMKAGWEIASGMPDEGECEPGTKIRHDIDPKKTIERLKPNVIMTGLADPIHLGQLFGLGANRLGIRLGFVEDLWFSHRRSTALPSFVCTLDAYGQRAIN